MTEDFLNIGIGTIEQESLQPADVQIQGVKIVDIKKKGSEEKVGEKIVLICKHPSKDEVIELSNAKLIVNDNVKLSTLWFNLDSDKKLSKSSAAALLLKHYNVNNYNELIGKQVSTTTQSDGNKYLCIKAY